MIILRKLFSRHTPKNLKKYERNSDEDIENMSKGQRLKALEKEDKIAADNTNSYVVKKGLKWGTAGTLAGAATGALVGKGARPQTALALGIGGAGLGTAIGALRGEHFADKEGHNRDKRTKRLARRMDDIARRRGEDDDYEYRNNDRIRLRKSEEEARAARIAAQDAAWNARGARWGY